MGGPGAAAKLSQVRSALMQRARALEAQLQSASAAVKAEDMRIERLSTQLDTSAEDRKRDSTRLFQEFLVFDQRQQDLEAQLREAGLGSNFQAAKVRSENEALREELQELQTFFSKKSEAEAENDQAAAQAEEVEKLQLEAALAQVEEEGRALEEELAKL